MIEKINTYYRNKRLLINASFSVLQVVFLSLSYFVIYTILLKKLGPSQLGIWSLVLATSSVGGVASAGLSSSLVKYVSLYSIDTEYKKINKLIQTGLISVVAFNSVIVIILYFVGSFFLRRSLSSSEAAQAIDLLPYSLVSLLINTIGGIFVSVLEGLHHSFLRSVTYIVSSICFLGFAFLLISDYGLMGVAAAQIIQCTIVVLLAMIMLKKIFKKFTVFPLAWDLEVFKETFRYSLNFQAISIFSILTEPLSKFLLSRFAGLSFVGYYELASRLVTQVRAVIISANQVVVPFVSSKYSKDSNSKDESYPIILRFMFYLSAVCMLGLIVFSPLISLLWIGSFNTTFIFSMIIICIGMFVNIVSTPSYFSSMGMGFLKGILISHLSILAVNAFLGFILGRFFMGWGIVASYSLSLVIGSAITIIFYHNKYKFDVLKVIGNMGIWNVILLLLITCSVSYLYIYYPHLNKVSYLLIGVLAIGIYLAWIYLFENKVVKFFKDIVLSKLS